MNTEIENSMEEKEEISCYLSQKLGHLTSRSGDCDLVETASVILTVEINGQLLVALFRRNNQIQIT